MAAGRVKELEDNAMKVVRSTDNRSVIAGPGSGKTKLLAQRAAYLLQWAYLDHLAEFSRSATSVMLQATLPRVCAVVAIPNKLTALTCHFRCLCERLGGPFWPGAPKAMAAPAGLPGGLRQ